MSAYEHTLPFAAFLANLPKTETHLHIEGALPWHLLHALDAVKFPHPPASWHPEYRFRDFDHFESELLAMAFGWYTSPERYHEAAKLIFARHLAQNVRYVETSFASGVVEFGGLDGHAIVKAIKSAAPAGLTVKVFCGIHHNGYNERTRDFLEDCIHWPELDGLDLHGTESMPLEDWTARLWQKARDAGKFTKAHAGEFCGPEFVRQVIHELGVRRIEHGVRAAEDSALLAEMAALGVACDVCPISNVKLGPTRSLATHQIRLLHDAGVVCTVNTDDPLSFGNTLTEEYLALHREAAFTRNELVALAKNGFKVAMIPDNDRQRVLGELDEWVAKE
ncbi:MAG: adenosine deaminase [Verrucomicrobiota bacterium]|nr:adenosine deaminase [Verrucomicrobiota bacterium]